MRTIILLSIVMMAVSCGGAKSEWDEVNAKQNCVYSFTEGPEAALLDSLVERKNAYKICDCIIEKAVSLYKDEQTMLKDDEGFVELLDKCINKVKAALGK